MATFVPDEGSVSAEFVPDEPARQFSFSSDIKSARRKAIDAYNRGLADEGSIDQFTSLENEFKSAKVGGELTVALNPLQPTQFTRIVKTGDDSYSAPEYKGPTTDSNEALEKSAITSVIPGGAGMRAAGLAANVLSKTKPIIQLLGGALSGAGGAIGVGALQNKIIEKVNPEKAELLSILAQEHPQETLIGSALGGNAPYQKIAPSIGATLRSELIQRATGAGIGGGIEAGRQAVFDTDMDLSKIGGQVAIGSLFSDPTKLGRKAFEGNLISKLGNASTKKNIPESVAVVSEIALEQPKSAEESAQILSGLMPAKMASQSAEVMKTPIRGLSPEVLGPEIAYANEQPALPTVERAQTLEGLMPTQPANETLLAGFLKRGEPAPAEKVPEPKAPERSVRIGDAEYAHIGGEWVRATGETVTDPVVIKALEGRAGTPKTEFVPDTPQAPANALKTDSETQPISTPTPELQRPLEGLKTTQEGHSDEPAYPLSIRNGDMVDSQGRKVVRKGGKYSLGARFAGQGASIAEPLLGYGIGSQIGDTEEERDINAKRGFLIGAGVAMGAKGVLSFGQKPGLLNMTAFHGTPHKIDKFSTEKIGAGEGAQVYGHGLYFAENPKVATSYKELLSGPGSGNLYQVHLDIKPEEMLAWDKSLSEQPELVRNALRRLGFDGDIVSIENPLPVGDATYEYPATGQTIYEALSQSAGIEKKAGWRGNIARPEEASRILNEAGIKGIKYSDQGSRMVAVGSEPTNNFVIFDDSRIRIVKENDKPVDRGVSGGQFGSESGAVINPFPAIEKAVGKGVEIAKEGFAQAKEQRTKDRLAASGTPDVENPSPVIQQPTPVNSSQEAANLAAKALKLRQPYDPATGKELPDAIAHNDKVFEDRVAKRSREIWGEESSPPKVVNDVIKEAPEGYKPLLTDLASAFPWMKSVPGGEVVSKGLGSIAKSAKKWVGVLETNIKEHSPRVFGHLRNYIFEKNNSILKYEGMVQGLGREARRNLTSEEFIQLDAANLSGDRAAAEAIFKSKGPEIEAKLMEAYDANQQAKAELRQEMIDAGIDVGQIDNYFSRKVIDREGLRKAIGASDPNAYDDMLKALAKSKDKPVSQLSEAEKDQALNNLISGSFRGKGKPGYLKPRTIETISKDLLKYYEPFDVVDSDYVMKAVRDLTNKRYFGKTASEKDSSGNETPFSGTFGRVIQEEIEAGRLDKGRGFVETSRALQDYFQNSTRYDADLSKMANALRRAQTYLYLGDVANAIPQFGDYFNGIMHYGLRQGTQGFFSRKFGLEDLKIHEGMAHELQDYRRQGGPRVIGKLYQPVLKHILGATDRFGKSGLANSAYRWVSEVATQPESRAFQKLSKSYSDAFGEARWNDILTDLKSPEFKAGKLNDNTRFFLFNELANLQPIDAAGRAQGYNSAGPWGKLLYGLRSFAIKQVDYMRREIYDELKAGNTAQALGKLGAYLVLVGAGQQALSFGKDKLLGRDAEPSEYALAGALQLMMIPRFLVYKTKEGNLFEGVAKTMIPGASALDDFYKDAQTFNAMRVGQVDKTGQKTVQDIPDLFRKLRSVQYLPGIGRELYWWAGRGAEQTKKQAEEKSKGKEQPTTYQMLSDIISPPDLKGARK